MVEIPVKMYMTNLFRQARKAVRPMALLSGPAKNQMLTTLADTIDREREALLAANEEDVLAIGKALEGEKDKDRVKAAVERVRITDAQVTELVDFLRALVAWPDPVGEIVDQREQPTGLQVGHMRVPIGMLGILSELNPRKNIELLALCFKTGNATIFRGTPDWPHTTPLLSQWIFEALAEAGAPPDGITIVDRPEKEAALELMRANKQQLDALIVRGGAGLRKTAVETTRLPVIAHDGGICHGYIDEGADLAMAQNLVVNSKIQQADATTSLDTVLVHEGIARQFLPALIRRLLDEFNVDVKGCVKTVAMIAPQPLAGYRNLVPVQEDDWTRQFVSPTLAVKMVNSVDEALEHIAQFGQGQTAFICTRSYPNALRFTREVDASAVFVNASSRLHAGDAMGIGGDIGIGHGRLTPRGPIGLDALTCLKYVAYGMGQLRHPHPVPVTYEDAIMLRRY
ncbi:MAG: glutamate-5-semialdehyde dehydrogenase [Nitrospiraceae bacterium]